MPLPTIPLMNCGQALLREGMKGREKHLLWQIYQVNHVTSEWCHEGMLSGRPMRPSLTKKYKIECDIHSLVCYMTLILFLLFFFFGGVGERITPLASFVKVFKAYIHEVFLGLYCFESLKIWSITLNYRNEIQTCCIGSKFSSIL